MAQIQVQDLEKEYGDRKILDNVSFDLWPGERVGLVGDNGCGKSTLLRLLAGRILPDGGSIRFLDGGKVGLLEQAPVPPGQVSYERRGELASILGSLELGREKLEAPGEILSGGERAKLALAALLAENPGLLLLDEPTNNLDYEGVLALTEMLEGYPGTLLAVSHDRWFLDRTVTRVLELAGGKLTEYFGNYTDYREEKARLYSEQLHRWEEDKRRQERVESAIRQLREFSDKGHRLSTEKDTSGLRMGQKEYKRKQAKQTDRRVKSQMKRLEKLREEGEARPRGEAKVRFEIGTEGRRGKRILEARGLSAGYDGQPLFQKADFALSRGEHAALYGSNGCGKTTFLRILRGELAPMEGELWLSPAGEPCCLSQNILDLPEGKTPLQFFTGLWGNLTGEQRTRLACMGLGAGLLGQKIGRLSLGERMKVKLAELIFSRRDFLVLDEPTNYLDLHARETLEEALASFEGTLLVVSHDLYFLERVCDRTLAFEDGSIRRYELPFGDYLKRRGIE